MAHARARLLLLSALLVLPSVIGCSEMHTADRPDAGNDAWIIDDAPWFVDSPPPSDGGSTSDGGGVVSCTPQDAHAMECPSAICDGFDSYAWDGERCVRIDCGTCVGADCGHLPISQADCEALHASCVPELCRASGGDWLFWAEECHHYHCGQSLPSECLVGMPVCDCGNGRSFDVAQGGCFDDPSCPEVDPLPPETLCTSTGGAWMSGICCPTRCGQFCDADCAADACACGALQVFDAVRGCIDAAECHVVSTGAECNEQVRCADGLLCCQHCGGAGCSPTMNCQAPLCDADPTVDVCGNDLLAP